MDLDLIERLMQMMNRSGIGKLDIRENGMRIRMSKEGAAQRPAAPTTRPDAPPAVASTATMETIVSGLPGTFYRAPQPGETPFVSLGDAVVEGQKLAIVEAMKMMNPVEAACDGTIVAIHVGDAAPVSAGTVLFTIERTSGTAGA